MPPEPSATVLVVDDDKSIVALVTQVLQDNGFQVESASSLFRAEGAFRRCWPQMVILDRQLPDGDGLRFCESLRKDERTRAVPVLFLSAEKRGVGDRVAGLDAGGDDYLVKPFKPEELLARVRSLMRRSKLPVPTRPALKAGSIVIDLDGHKVFVNDEEVALWPKEYYLLSALAGSLGKVFSREALLGLVWGPGKDVDRTPKVVDVTVSNLKKKLGRAGAAIATVRGEGFRLDPPAA